VKKIEAIIKRSSYPLIANQLNTLGYTIIDKRNLEDNKIIDQQKGSKAGSTGIKTIPLSKIELVVSEKDARKVIDIISKKSGFSDSQGGKIFISEMEEIVDMETLEGQKDLESLSETKVRDYEEFDFTPRPKIKRSRLVPLQKHTLYKIHQLYEDNQEKLKEDYRIKSFSDFVNHCILGYLPTIEKQLKHPTMVYENKFGDF